MFTKEKQIGLPVKSHRIPDGERTRVNRAALLLESFHIELRKWPHGNLLRYEWC
jgi:hypothetical protein